VIVGMLNGEWSIRTEREVQQGAELGERLEQQKLQVRWCQENKARRNGAVTE